MYNILHSAHSGLRWVVLITVVIALIMGFMNSGDNSANRKNSMALIALISTHIQVLIGIILYFISPKVNFGSEMMSNSMYRFFTVEHGLLMLIGAVLVTIGYSKSKKKATFGEASKTVGIFYLIALLLFLARIPWPFQEGLGAGWF